MIGKGTFGVVHRGAYRGLPVAIKRLQLPCSAPGAPELQQLKDEFRLEVAMCCALRHPNVTTLGYVHSSYGKRPLAEYQKEITAYASCWGTGGIFVDEASSAAAQIPYYADVAKAIRSSSPGASVWLNPGTGTDQGYLSVADVLVQFESPDKEFSTFRPPSYLNSSADPLRCTDSRHTHGKH